MKFGFVYCFSLAFILPLSIVAQGCSGTLKHWCSATQKCITLGDESCPSISGVVLIGPGKLQRNPSVVSATCLILTPTTCGVDVLSPGYAYTIGPGFELKENCALSCVGYTMVPLEASGTGTFTSGGGTTSNFVARPTNQVATPGYQHVVGKGGWRRPKTGGRFLRGEKSN